MIQQGLTGADPGFFSVRGAPLRNGVKKKIHKPIQANTKKKASSQELDSTLLHLMRSNKKYT